MNLGIRAILYSARKWKKTLLVFFLLLAIATLVLSGLFIGKVNAKGIAINRKVMADLAMNEPKAFEAIVKAVK